MRHLKILQVINSLYSGGAEKLVVETCRKMSSLGHSIDVFLLRSGNTHLQEAITEIPDVHLITHDSYPGIYSPKWILKLQRQMRKKEYDAIHVHLFPSFYWSGIAGWISGNKHLLHYTEHNTTNRRRESTFLKLTDRFVYSKYNQIITISDAVDNNLKEHLGNTKVSISKIYNGINLDEIKNAEPYSIDSFHLPKTSRIILQVSSFTPQKDQPTVIKAMKHLPTNFHVFFVGDGPTRIANEALANKLDLKNRVHFLGIRNDVPRLLKTVDFVVLSSHFEGLSLSSVEGLASGRPFLASNVPGLREVVANAGILFEDGDEKALAKSLIALNSDNEFLKEITRKCLQRAENYNISSMVQAYLNLYQK